MDQANIEQFRTFVRDARRLLESDPRASEAHTPTTRPPSSVLPRADDGPPVEAFLAFIDTATPLATEAARRYLRWFMPHAERITRAVVEHDIILVAGYHNVENSYTRLLGWVLGYKNDSALATAVQRRLIARLRPALTPSQRLNVIVECSTKNGCTPDLVLVNDDLVVVIEAKTVTREHLAAQTDEPQTTAYMKAVRETLPVAESVQGLTVLLSIEGDEPADSDANAATFAEVALVILEAIDTVEASFDQKWPYRAIASHWLIHAMPGVDVRAISRAAADWGALDGRELLGKLPDIMRIERLAPSRGEV